MADNPFEIQLHHYKQYESEVRIRAQQLVSKLRDRVLVKNLAGEESFMDQLGLTEAEKNNERSPKSPNMDIEHFRRRIVPNRYHFGRTIDEFDKIKMLTDPKSRYVVLAGGAIGRAYDTEIIDAALGTSVAISPDESTTNVSLPTTQAVGVTVGAANGSDDVNMNDAKVRRAVKILEGNDVDLDLPENKLYGVWSPAAKESILGQDRVASSDFNNMKPLVTGQFVQWMGVEWIVSNRLTSPATDQRDCFIYAMSGIGLGVYTDVTVKGGERGDLSYSDYAYVFSIFGASRLEEEKVVKITIDETATATAA